MNFRQVLIITLVVLYLIYTNMFYITLLMPLKSKKMTEKATVSAITMTPTSTKYVITSNNKGDKGESYVEKESSFSQENYIADWGENAMKDKKQQQVKECLGLKDDNDSSIVSWAARQEYLAKGACNESKFCPCNRDEMIV